MFVKVWRYRIKAIIVALVCGVCLNQSVQANPMTDQMVDTFAARMYSAANNKDIAAIADLIVDDALISLTRKGQTTSLTKADYLKLLQNSWAKTTDYKFQIVLSNVVTTDNHAKVNVKTSETWRQNGKPVQVVTQSRVTLVSPDNKAVLSRAINQVDIH